MRLDPAFLAAEAENSILTGGRHAAAGAIVHLEKTAAILRMHERDNGLSDDLRKVAGTDHRETGGVHVEQQPFL